MNLPHSMQQSAQPRVVIIGGGFAGLQLVRTLKNQDVQVVVLDKNNYHTFQPLLYQVATAGLEPDSIAYPLRKIFKGYHNVHFRLGEATGILPEQAILQTTIGDMSYDHLVIATGTKTNYFGMSSVAENAMGMKTVPEALDIRSVVLQSFEEATITADPKRRQELMTFVVVGGGPTGVETAGALAELKKHVLYKDFPELDLRLMRIYLLEGSPRLLNGMSEIASKKAIDFLQAMGVNVLPGAQVKSYDGETIVMNDGSTIISRTLIWAAGVAGAVIPGLESAIERGNRYSVDEYNRVKGYENIFAIGDVALMLEKDSAYPYGHPMMAPVAMQQGVLLGKNILRCIQGKELQPFAYFDKGSMATVGRNKAVADIRTIRFQGWFAWVAWLLLHVYMLIGFRNKLIVSLNWVWNYLTYDRGTRLIVRPFRRKRMETKAEQ